MSPCIIQEVRRGTHADVADRVDDEAALGALLNHLGRVRHTGQETAGEDCGLDVSGAYITEHGMTHSTCG